MLTAFMVSSTEIKLVGTVGCGSVTMAALIPLRRNVVTSMTERKV